MTDIITKDEVAKFNYDLQIKVLQEKLREIRETTMATTQYKNLELCYKIQRNKQNLIKTLKGL